MRAYFIAALAAIVLSPSYGQIDTRVNTSAGTSVNGAINTRTGGAIDDRVGIGKARDEPPREVLRYLRDLRGGGTGAAGSLSVGETVPDSAVRGIPGNSDWGYAFVNGQPVVVDRNTNKIVEGVR